MRLQFLKAFSPGQAAVRVAPRCTPPEHSHCRRPSATAAACPCAVRPGRGRGPRQRKCLRRDGGATRVARASTKPAIAGGGGAAVAGAGHSSTWDWRSSLASTGGQGAVLLLPPILVLVPFQLPGAVGDVAASTAGGAAVAAGRWAGFRLLPGPRRGHWRRSCWADPCRRCRGLGAWPGPAHWSRSGAEAWGSSADRRSALAEFG